MEIKLIIWDLDNTFWKGSLEENNVIIVDKNINYIKNLNENGVVNSICSHNIYEKAISILEKNNINNYFIFPKINNNPKGPQILEIIKQCNLKENNVLFIDDKFLNLKEAQHYCPNLNILDPNNIDFDKTINNIIKSGQKKSRLEYYKILENKYEERINKNINNEDFLKLSDISVYIETFKQKHFDRVFELINRTNQLNFTKNRCSKEELKECFNFNSYVIYVYDKFGEYGLSGFVSFNKDVLHFLFSCRVLNMGVENYIFKYLNLPKFKICDDVVGNLNTKSDWIKIKKSKGNKNIKSKNKILFIGGCDLEQTAHYIKNSNTDYYFNYVNEKNPKNIVHRDSIDFILNNLDKEQKKFIIDTCPFIDENVFNVPEFSDYMTIIYSPLIDYIQGKYISQKISNYYLSCNPFLSSELTEEKIKDMFNDRGITKEEQLKFKNNWRFAEKSDNFYYNQLFRLFEKFNNSVKIIVLLGATNTYSNLDKDKFLKHKINNNIIKNVANNFNNIALIEVDRFINSKDNFTNSIRHYSRDVYYNIAEEINKYLK